jgi:hypothetical protein
MQHQRRLEIPEVFFFIESFLPLWVLDNPERAKAKQASFKRKTLCTCLQVSKLWHRPFLPIIWYRYEASWDLRDVPTAVLGHHSHHLGTLCLNDRFVAEVDMDHAEEHKDTWMGKLVPNEKLPTCLLHAKAESFDRTIGSRDSLSWEGALNHVATLDANDFCQTRKT